MKRNYIEEWNLMPIRSDWQPLGWEWCDWTNGAAAYVNERKGLSALMSAHKESDGNPWLHLSLCHRDRIPTYQEMQGGRRAFLYEKLAYQCFVPSAEHVNIHPHVLHLWSPVGHRPLPDFRHDDGTI